MEAFQLRLWDGRLGRWLSVDPYGQYHSPYLGMGNNPVNMIDPDGGFATGGCPECPNGGDLNEVTVTGSAQIPKIPKLKYGGNEWDDIIAAPSVFGTNALVSAINGITSIWNYAGQLGYNGSSVSEKISNDFNNVKNAVTTYAQNTTPKEFGNDVGNALSKVSTYEDIAGAVIGTKGFGAVKGLGSISKTARMGLTVRGSYKAHFSNWKNYTEVMKSRGVATEHIAKRVSNARLAARSRYQLQTPFIIRMSIYGRNITPSWVPIRFPIGGKWIKPGGYGNIVGPNWKFFRSKGYSWDRILEGSLKSNSKL